ncbi:helix-turn-helix domain-containing protein [Arcanobacterium phocae]|uniref:helix-turn-helix domain-containing protein n=1 Tax=Arcanobacterium phocae TaxID=131112 RepID=UPI001C0F2CB5|nr:helix-turn-helix domain-containing protein [Arcanobacterium phocae]
MENISQKKLYTLYEAAQVLGIAVPTLRKWEYAGKIKATRLGRRVMISDTTLNTIIDEGVN